MKLILSLILTLASTLGQDRTIDELVNQLTDPDLIVRDAARARLVKAGRKAIPHLRVAAGKADENTKRLISQIIASIEWNENVSRLKTGLSKDLLEEVPGIIDSATSQDESLWLSLLRALTGIGLEEFGVDDDCLCVISATRKAHSTKRRDIAALAEFYCAGSWRSARVTRLLYSITQLCGVPLAVDLVQSLSPEKGWIIPRTAQRTHPTFPLLTLMSRGSGAKSDLAREALGKDRASSEKALLRLSSIHNNAIRLEVLDRLQSHLSNETYEVMLGATKDSDIPIRQAGLRGLGWFGREESIDVLSPFIEQSSNIEIAREAVKALSRIASPCSESIFLKTLQRTDDGLQMASLDGLVRIGALTAVPAIRDLLDRSCEDVICASMIALAQLGDRDIRPYARNATSKCGLREAAIQALELSNDRDGCKALDKYLDDIDPDVRLRAGIALARFGFIDMDSYRNLLPNVDHLLYPDYVWGWNWLRYPILVRRIESIELNSHRYRGSVSEIVEIWGKETGVKVACGLPSDITAQTRSINLPVNNTLGRGLRQISGDLSCSIVVDECGELRLQTYEQTKGALIK